MGRECLKAYNHTTKERILPCMQVSGKDGLRIMGVQHGD